MGQVCTVGGRGGSRGAPIKLLESQGGNMLMSQQGEQFSKHKGAHGISSRRCKTKCHIGKLSSLRLLHFLERKS